MFAVIVIAVLSSASTSGTGEKLRIATGVSPAPLDAAVPAFGSHRHSPQGPRLSAQTLGDQTEEKAPTADAVADEQAPEGAASETAASETAAPETAAPETAAPETAASESTTPETAASETAAPETAASETAASETAAPENPSVENAAMDAETDSKPQQAELSSSAASSAPGAPISSDEDSRVSWSLEGGPLLSSTANISGGVRLLPGAFGRVGLGWRVVSGVTLLGESELSLAGENKGGAALGSTSALVGVTARAMAGFAFEPLRKVSVLPYLSAGATLTTEFVALRAGAFSGVSTLLIPAAVAGVGVRTTALGLLVRLHLDGGFDVDLRPILTGTISLGWKF